MASDASDDRRVSQITCYDRYGFAVYDTSSEFAVDDCRTHEYRQHSDAESSKVRQFWTKTLSNWEENQLFSPKRVRCFIKQGVPDDMRGKIWNKMVGSQAIKATSLFDYQACLAEIRQLLVDLGVSEYGGTNCISRLGQIVASLVNSNKENLIDSPNTVIMTRQWKRNLHKQISVFRQIMLDIDRSFPSHKMFIEGTSEGKEGRATLFRVLAVYAMYNPQVSYCQGMSYIAGMFLMNMDEEDSFWCLVSMFERPKYLAGYFNDSLGKIQRHASVFERLMRQRRTKLYKHLEMHGVSPLMYLTPWFMALFTSLPCWDAVLTIWDLLLLEGMSIIFQVALALLDVLSVEILPLTEIAQVLPILLRPSASLITREKLVAAIWKVKPIQRWEIDSIQAILDEEEAGCKANTTRGNKRSLNNQNEDDNRKRQRTFSNQSPQAPAEPSLFQRFVGFFSSNDESEAKFTTNDIEMTTFSVVSGQSPSVLTPSLCCSAAGALKTQHGKVSGLRKPVGQHKRHNRYNKVSRRRSNNGKDVLRKRHVVFQGSLGSPVRRSPRFAGQRTPVGTVAKVQSPNSLVRSSATNQHAFKQFNTPTPLRRSQVKPLFQHSPSTFESSPKLLTSPDLLMSPDLEMTSFECKEKRLDFT